MNTMTRDQKIGGIRKKCVEANPEIVTMRKRRRSEALKDRIRKFYIKVEEMRPIRLGDVLFVVARSYDLKPKDFRVNMNGLAKFHIWGMAIDTPQGDLYWNLLKDDLTLQSDETVDFLWGLLESKGE